MYTVSVHLVDSTEAVAAPQAVVSSANTETGQETAPTHNTLVEFACSSKDLARAMKILASLKRESTYLYILDNVRIEAQENSVVLYRTNLEIGMGITVPANVKTAGVFIVDAENLNKIVQSIKGDCTVTVKQDGPTMLLTVNGTAFSLPIGDLQDYPDIVSHPHDESMILATIDARALARASGLVQFAALSKKESSRPELTQVLLEIHPSCLNMVATDGYRMAIMAISPEIRKEDRFTVPKALAQVLAKIYKTLKQPQTVTIARDEERAYTVFPSGIWVWGRIGEDEYPWWQKVVPDMSTAREMIVDRQALIAAIEKVQVSLPSHGGVIFEVAESSPNTLKLTTQEAHIGYAEALVPCTGDYTGKIELRARYLLEPLKLLTSERVKFYLHDSQTAVVLKPCGQDPQENGYTYVQMPMAL